MPLKSQTRLVALRRNEDYVAPRNLGCVLAHGEASSLARRSCASRRSFISFVKHRISRLGIRASRSVLEIRSPRNLRQQKRCYRTKSDQRSQRRRQMNMPTITSTGGTDSSDRNLQDPNAANIRMPTSCHVFTSSHSVRGYGRTAL